MIVVKVLFFTVLVSSVICAEFPSTFKRCNRADQVCLKQAIQEAIPKFAKGFKSLGVPGIDPLTIPLMEIPGGNGAVKISQKVTDGKLYGLSTAVIDDFIFDVIKVDNAKIAWNFHIPNITLKANYEMTGQILVLPVKGKGVMNILLENVKGDEKIKVVTYTKNNLQYIKVNDTVLKMDAGHVTFNLDNVFDGNKQLSDQINQVMNDNWSAVFDEIKDGYNDAIRTFMDHIVNSFFAKFAVSEIFLD
ncbi:circadian clock-controlled protein daywake-like [Harmonia axyridis]|uniref:circadian clock-controlled protein daywake-like n=1 Tax=Harmonia axyridis TaxID=115357 RepID=UPI001E278236|nr:circadian clock-controlled protein daywake-like [Harmonia axyridis]